MKRKYKGIISWILSVVMVLSLTITNFNLYYAEDVVDDVATDSIIDEIPDEYFGEGNEIVSDDINHENEEDEAEEDGNDTMEDDEEATSSEIEDDIDDVDADDLEEESNESTDTEVEDETDEEATPSEIDDAMNEEVATSSDVENDIEATPSETEEDTEDAEIISTPSEASLSNALFTESINENEKASPSDVEVGGALGFIPVDIEFPKLKKKLFLDFFGDAQLPASYDARTETNPNNSSMSVVPAVRDQNPYGICWAFSTIGMIETSIRKKGLVTTEADADLSEGTLAYYYYNMEKLYENATTMLNMDEPGLEGKDYTKLVGGNWSSQGGNQLNATLVMASYVGAVKEEEGTTDPTSIILSGGLDTSYIYKKNKFVINNVQYINKTETNEIKKAIMANGSVGISYYEGSSFCHEDNGEYYYLSTKTPGDSNHAVMVVGWDDSISKTKFTTGTATHNGAWLVRNSWGDTSRNEGYFWMSYDEPSLYQTVFSIDAIKADTYKYNYHYDTTGASFTTGYPVSNAIANVFRVPEDGGDQVLDAVNLSLYSAGIPYKISIYTKDTQMSNPEDGVCATTQTGNSTNAGIYTVALDDKVTLQPGTYFSVVLSPLSGSLSVLFDMNINAGSVKFCNMTSTGETYEKKAWGWEDQHEQDNAYEGDGNTFTFRIKALTNPASGVGFSANGGTGTMARLNGAAGSSVTIPANAFTKTGYTFVKWNTEEDGTGTDYAVGSSITITDGAITLYAQWEEISYTLKLNPNESGQTGTITSGTETSETLTYEQTKTLSNPGFVSSSHTFDGWQKTSGSGTKDYEKDAEVSKLAASASETVTLYAHWIPGAYIVTFDGNGATGGTMSSQNITVGQSANLTQNAYTRTGYTFAGWATASDAEAAYADKASFNKADAVKDQTYTLYAKWTPITYKIRYNTNGGSVNPTQATKTYDTNLTLDTPTKTGYQFVAWYKENTFVNSYDGSSDLSTTQNAVVDVYAKWTLADGYVEAIYDSNGGSAVPSQAVLNGEKFTRPSNPTRSGYSFANWYEENTFITIYDFDLIATQSITLYAKWNQNNSGGNSSSGNYSSGSSSSSDGSPTVGPLSSVSRDISKSSKQENAKTVAPRGNDTQLLSQDVSWRYDVVNGTWSLNINISMGSKATNGFYMIASLDMNGGLINDVYNFDENGNMVTGWAKDANGNMYFFENLKNENEGKMTFGWKEVEQGKWYYFNQEGMLMTNTMTADGYYVGADGQWFR